MISEEERCRLAVNELRRLSYFHGILKPGTFEKVAKKAKIDVKTLYNYINENGVIL